MVGRRTAQVPDGYVPITNITGYDPEIGVCAYLRSIFNSRSYKERRAKGLELVLQRQLHVARFLQLAPSSEESWKEEDAIRGIDIDLKYLGWRQTIPPSGIPMPFAVPMFPAPYSTTPTQLQTVQTPS